MSAAMSRRAVVRSLLTASGILVLAQRIDAAQTSAIAPSAGSKALPHLKGTDSMAEAVSYCEDAKGIHRSAAPEYKPGQQCANCASLSGASSDAWRPCALIPGYAVNSAGWCQMYVKKA